MFLFNNQGLYIVMNIVYVYYVRVIYTPIYDCVEIVFELPLLTR
jgi:hypothetical protein